jgi:plasmid stabilization system protein ParE
MQAWSNRDERQYEHIKESQIDRGSRPREATEITARTVNKRRREEGRTANRRTMGTGNPRAPLEERSKDELYNLAEESNIRGRSRMNKNQLITALRRSGASSM